MVPRNARILAEHTAAHIEIQPKGTECCHFRKKVICHSEIHREDADDGIKPVYETRRIHAVRSVGLDGIVQVHNTDCCCKSCLGGGGKCEYEDYRDEWRSIMVRGKGKKRFVNHWNFVAYKINPKKRSLVKPLRETVTETVMETVMESICRH